MVVVGFAIPFHYAPQWGDTTMANLMACADLSMSPLLSCKVCSQGEIMSDYKVSFSLK